MNDYLLLLRKLIARKKQKNLQETEIKESENAKESENVEMLKNVAEKLGVDFASHDLKRLYSEGTNRFDIDDTNLIYFYAPNDGKPTCPVEFYKDNVLVLDNQEAYSQITNLDEIMIQLVRTFDSALDQGIVIDPYYFMLRLDDEIKDEYNGKATLAITEKALSNSKINNQSFDEATKYFINRFLDHFIGWNFGVSVNRNETLKNELEDLNAKVINAGIREWAGPGFEVYGVDDEAYHGLQHYTLSRGENSRLIV